MPSDNRDFTKKLYSPETLMLMDIVPLERILHSVDHVLRTGKRTQEGYAIETFNAVMILREAMTRVIHELAAKSMPAPQKESLTSIVH